MTQALKNDQLIQALGGHFVRRGLATSAWNNAISSYLMLPGLRGFWTMSSVSEGGNAYDLSGQGRTLTYTGNPTYNLTNLAPYLDFDGTGDYLTRADEAGLDILGSETSIATALRGLTVGGWFWWDGLTTNEGLITKGDTGAATTAFVLLHAGGVAGDPIRFTASGGTLKNANITDAAAITASTWHFCVGRFVPSTSVDLFVDTYKNSNTTTIPAALNNVAVNFNIGAYNDGTAPLNGRASLCFLCGAALPDWVIRALYHTTRALFGVR